MALVGYLIVFSFVTKCGQTIEFPLWGTIVPLNFLVGYHCSIEFPCGVPLFYCCKYPTLYTHTHALVNDQTLQGPLLFFPLSLYLTHSHRLCTRMTSEDRWEQRTDSRGPIVPIEKCPRRVWPSLYTHTVLCKVYIHVYRGPPLFPSIVPFVVGLKLF